MYYPVKVITVRDDFVYFIPFRWPAGRRLQLKSSGADFQEFSTELPEDVTLDEKAEKAKSEKFQKEWDASCKVSTKIVSNLSVIFSILLCHLQIVFQLLYF